MSVLYRSLLMYAAVSYDVFSINIETHVSDNISYVTCANE